MPLANVRVIGHYMGGGFGSKLSSGKYSIIAALLARKTGRPVRLFLTREQVIRSMGNRPANTITLKAGAKKDGTLVALQSKVVGTGGAYSAGGTGLADFLVRELYTCPNVRCENQAVYINAGPERPFRAPGHPQGAWALEITMDALAAKLGLDPIEFRLKNIPTVSQARGGLPYTTTGLAQCLTDGAKAFGWTDARAKKPAPGSHVGSRRGRGGRPLDCRQRRSARDGHREAVQRRQRAPQHGRERHRLRHQDVGRPNRRRGAPRAPRAHLNRARRHGDDAVRDAERREQDGADRVARDPRGRARGEAAAPADGRRPPAGAGRRSRVRQRRGVVEVGSRRRRWPSGESRPSAAAA